MNIKLNIFVVSQRSVSMFQDYYVFDSGKWSREFRKFMFEQVKLHPGTHGATNLMGFNHTPRSVVSVYFVFKL